MPEVKTLLAIVILTMPIFAGILFDGQIIKVLALLFLVFFWYALADAYETEQLLEQKIKKLKEERG